MKICFENCYTTNPPNESRKIWQKSIQRVISELFLTFQRLSCNKIFFFLKFALKYANNFYFFVNLWINPKAAKTFIDQSLIICTNMNWIYWNYTQFFEIFNYAFNMQNPYNPKLINKYKTTSSFGIYYLPLLLLLSIFLCFCQNFSLVLFISLFAVVPFWITQHSHKSYIKSTRNNRKQPPNT